MHKNLPMTDLLKDLEQCSMYIYDNEYDVTHFSFISEEVALILWHFADGYSGQTHDINVFLGAFTTAHACLELYNIMDTLGKRLLYSETDRLIFVSKDGDWEHHPVCI